MSGVLSPAFNQALGALITTMPGADQPIAPDAPSDARGQPAPLTSPAAFAPPSEEDLLARSARRAAASSEATANVTAGATMGAISDEARDRIKAFKAEQAAQKTEVEVKRPAYEEYAAQVQALSDRFQNIMKESDKQVAVAHDDYLRATNDFKNTRVYDWWGQASTGAQMLGAISQIAAGALQGVTGRAGEPTAMDAVIRRDRDFQLAGLQQKGAVVEQARGVYKDLQGYFHDQQVATSALEEVAWTSAQRRAEAYLATMDPAKRMGVEGQRLQAAISTFAGNAAAARAKALPQVQEFVQRAQMKRADVDVDLAKLLSSENKAARKAAGSAGVEALTGVTYSEYLDKQSRRVLGERLEASDSADANAGALIELIGNRDKYSPKDFDARAAQISADLDLLGKNAAHVGRLAEYDIKFLNAMRGGEPSKWFEPGALFLGNTNEQVIKRIQEFRNMLQREKRASVGTYSVKLNQDVTEPDGTVRKAGSRVRLRYEEP